MGSLPGLTSLKKTHSPPPNSLWLPIAPQPSLLHAEISSALIMCMSCAGSHRCCCIQKTLLGCTHPLSLALTVLLTLLPQRSLSLGKRWHDTGVVLVCMRTAHMGIYVSVFGPQLVKLGKIWKYSLIGGGMSVGLDFEVIKVHAISH